MAPPRKTPYCAVCLHCRKDFQTYPSRKGRQFCSNECRLTHVKQEASITKTCIGCNNVFSSTNARAHKLYCSQECYFEHYEKSRPIAKGLKECIICGKEFTTYNKGVKCCSQECRKKLIAQKPHKTIAKEEISPKKKLRETLPKFVDRVCVICGVTFQAKRYGNESMISQTCSMECRISKAVRTKNPSPIEKTCKNCGKEFTVPKKFSNAMYCSNECRIANLPKGRPETYEIRPCAGCGQPVKVQQSLRHRKKFCSDACRFVHRTMRKPNPALVEMRTCLECGKPIAVKRCISHRKKFCSPSCRSRHTVRMQASLHPTSIEVRLYQALDLLGATYTQQYSMGHFVYDAWLPGHNTIIEADGTYWHSLPDRAARDKRLAEYAAHMGYTLIRLDEQFINSMSIQDLANHIKQLLP